MKRDGVNPVKVRVVVLKQALAARVKDLDLLVRAARGNALAIRVESHAGDHSRMISETAQFATAALSVKNAHSAIIATRNDIT